MSDDARRLRKHAFECRRLAEGTKDLAEHRILTEIGDELDAEAERIEGRDADATQLKDDRSDG